MNKPTKRRTDQERLDSAYHHIRKAMNELARTRQKDNILCRIQSTLYTLEDTLWEYTAESTRPEGREAK